MREADFEHAIQITAAGLEPAAPIAPRRPGALLPLAVSVALLAVSAAVRAEEPSEAGDFAARLEAVAQAFQPVARKLNQASSAGDEAKAESLVEEAGKLYREAVRAPLDALIASLDSQLEGLEKQLEGLDPKSQESETVRQRRDDIRQRRNLAELSRIRFTLLYAGMIPERSKERTRALEEGLELAKSFVANRDYYYVMQYEALIQKGLFLIELRRYDEAAAELEILFDIDPGTDPPYPPAIVKAFKDIRLKALLFGARALNGAGRWRESLRAIQEYYVNLPSSSPFYLGEAEKDADLKQNAVLLKLEHGVALAGAGDSQEGLRKIHEVIDRYTAEGEAGQPFVVDARKALGRIAAVPGVMLSGRDYYQAAIGLKSELRFKESLRLFQKALATLAPEDIKEYAPLCLNEIGEVSFLLGRHLESAVAYQEIARHFRDCAISSKVATNFLGAVSKARGADTANQALAALAGEADGYYREKGLKGSEVRYQAVMVDASRLLDEGKFDEAGAKFAEVPREADKQRISFYWRAQAMVHRCAFLAWDRAPAEEKAALAPKVDEGAKALPAIIDAARDGNEPLGMAVAALTLGQIHYARGEHQEAVGVLELFLDELAEDEYYRSMALGVLVLAATHVPEKIDKAEAAFKVLSTDFAEECATATAAYALSDYYSEAGGRANEVKAAFNMWLYAEHKCTQPDLQNLPLVMKIVQVLIEGNMITEARKYIDVAKALPKSEDLEAELTRQLLYMEAKIFYARKDYAGAIRVLEEYREKYGARGEYYEDPYVWQMMAESYYRYRGADGKLQPAALLKAEQYYDVARSILYRGFAGPAEAGAGEVRAALEKLYWQWVYRWLNFKYVIGTKLDKPTELRKIVVFLDESATSEMAGYKQQFLKLKQAAERASKRGSGGSR